MAPPTRTASRTATRSDARERARVARLRLDADRAERDRKLEEAAAAYFVGDTRRTELQEQLDDADRDMARAVTSLLELGESPSRVGTLLDMPAGEVRRLRSLARPADANADAATDDAASGDTSHPGESGGQ